MAFLGESGERAEQLKRGIRGLKSCGFRLKKILHDDDGTVALVFSSPEEAVKESAATPTEH